MKRGLGKHAQAWAMAHVSPHIERMMAERKQELLGGLRGVVVEIGPGTGPNLRYYARGVRWRGVEPNPFMHRYLREAARAAGHEGDVCEGVAEALPMDDGSADAVVSTLVLCSVGDARAALRETVRVLRPGGQFVFFEHVGAAKGSWRRRGQALLAPAWRAMADGCRLDQDTLELIGQAGFREVRAEELRLRFGPASPQIVGVAIK